MKIKNQPKFYKRATISVISLVCVAAGIATATFSYAWFTNRNDVTKDINGSTAGAYFGGGDGKSDNPYIISKPIHLYNLAWLYYIGFFKGQEPYFKITTDLNMSGWYLPPIGTSTNPFNGHLDGDSHTISSLNVTNDFSSLSSKKPSSVTESDWNGGNEKYGATPNILGLFGYISQESSDKGVPTVKNLKIDGETVTSCTEKALTGIVAGYVNGSLDKIYIDNSKVDLADNTQALGKLDEETTITNISEYTSVGYCTKSYRTEYTKYETTLYKPTVVENTTKIDTFTPDGGGSGDSYGGSIDVYGFYNKMSSVLSSTSNPLTVSSDYAIPIAFDSAGTKQSTTGKPSSIESSGTTINVDSYANTIPVDSTTANIGYYSGAMTVKKGITGISFDSITTASTSPIAWQKAWSSDTRTELTDKERTTIISKLTEKSTNDAIYLNSANSAFYGVTDDKTFPTGNEYYTVIKDGVIGKSGNQSTYYKGIIFIPKNGIWVAPRKAGRFQFIVQGDGSSLGTYALLIRLKRTANKEDTSTNYSNGFKNSGTYQVPMSNADWTYNILGFRTIGTSLVYYGIDIGQDDVDNGYEFFITSMNESNGVTIGYPYILYLDIGSSGDDGSTSETITRTKVFELLEQITQAFTYPTGVYVADFDNAVLDTKTLCITIGTLYSGEAKITRAKDATDLIVTASSDNTTGVAYYDTDLAINNTDSLPFVTTDKVVTETKRMTYYDYSSKNSTLTMFAFSQTSTDGGNSYDNVTAETQYQATYANSILGVWTSTSGQTVYNDDGTTSTDGIPAEITSGITQPSDFSTNNKIFTLKLKESENSFSNTYLSEVSLDSSSFKASVKGYDFTMTNGNAAITSDKYSIENRDTNYSLKINDVTA